MRSHFTGASGHGNSPDDAGRNLHRDVRAAHGRADLWPGIHYPDEIMQSLEQAHRLVFGNGLVPWEFRDGARSWLLPALLAAPMWLGDALAPETGAYRLLAQALVAALSASTVVIGFLWARKHGIRHAVLAAVVLCTWFELVYFGARALGEVVASAFLFTGVYLCAEREPRSPRHDFLAGVCLAGAFVFRFHLAPALALAAVWRCRAEFRARWVPCSSARRFRCWHWGSRMVWHGQNPSARS